MLPWEHLAVGYVFYSAWAHVYRSQGPDGRTVVALAVATQLPDLVDKPLGWWLGVTSSVGPGHSLVLTASVVLLAWVLVGGRYALPVGVGLLSHLLGDVFYKAVVGGRIEFGFLAWPFVEQSASGAEGFFSQFWYWTSRYVEFLTSPEGLAYLGFELTLLGSALALWVYDGFPGLAAASYRRESDARTGY